MAVREILQYGDKRLNSICEKVGKVDRKILNLVDDMMDTLYEGNGIGLAAPQIGVLKRVVLIDLGEEEGEPIVIINPRITAQSGNEKDYEGCLSYVGYEGEVYRPTDVTVVGINIKGKPVTYNATGLLARAFCHEIDHLEGIMYMSRAEETHELTEK
ncbi:peptide deformylase [Clostridium estertheticum]|uniref:Peptide deformylase n=1 Tax=Clostridium estertheticum TaxID=238834 RepID=A0A5N7J400_9CLOT|nr:peptide deformylase [Clostridium estertheticum]MBU3072897.1 peptide deformylase [Clostridium estertheticum]MBU3163066.1 peptide deformylase [Clostridium estertheticum]MBU3172696.1 peptide deformylase [Clostridium estertheticum]MBU3183800.1 peptide deformylase [Clostridium estertheticum]MCB2341642.1 peptide deformylase [Clostridium estertheticum]